MAVDCPYCGSCVSFAHKMDTDTEDGVRVSEVWLCSSCGKDFVAEYEFEGFYDSDGTPIEGGDE